MSIQDLGAIGEFIGSFFVLATLIYLAVQVRHSRELLEENRRLALSAAYQSRTGFRLDLAKASMDDSLVEIQSTLRGGHKFQSIEIQIQNFEKLTVEEKIKYMHWQEAVTHSIDNGLFQMELGFADKHVAQTVKETILSQYAFWQHTGCLIPTRVRDWYESNRGDA